MNNLLIEFAIAFLLLGITEAIVKPIAIRFIKRKAVKYSAIALEQLDKMVVNITDLSGAEIEEKLRVKLEELTGEDWSKEELNPFFEMHDVRINADKV